MGSRRAVSEFEKSPGVPPRRTRFERRVILFICLLVMPGLVTIAILLWLFHGRSKAKSRFF